MYISKKLPSFEVPKKLNFISKDESFMLKGCAIFLMIALHLFGGTAERANMYESYYSLITIGSRPIYYYFFKIALICTYFYMFLSGYGLYIAYIRSKENGVKKSIWHRSASLIAKMLFVAILFYPFAYFFPELKWNFTFPKCLLSLVGWGYNSQWWFIRPYLAMLLLSPIIIPKYYKYPKTLISISIVIYILSAISYQVGIYKSGTLLGEIIQIGRLQLSFILGLFAAQSNLLYNSSISQKKKTLLYSILGIAGLIIFMAFFRRELFSPFVTLFFCIFMVRIKLFDSLNKVLILLGKESTTMWLIHPFICLYYGKNILLQLHYPILILIITIVISYILSKFTSNLYKYLMRPKFLYYFR